MYSAIVTGGERPGYNVSHIPQDVVWVSHIASSNILVEQYHSPQFTSRFLQLASTHVCKRTLNSKILLHFAWNHFTQDALDVAVLGDLIEDLRLATMALLGLFSLLLVACWNGRHVDAQEG